MTEKSRHAASVIIAARDEEENIGELVESLLKQTFRNFEIIVVDDGSTDRTTEIVEKKIACRAAEPMIRLIRAQRGGVSKARNIGIRSASGDVIVILDADELPFDDRFVEKCMKFFEDHTVMLLFPFEKPKIKDGASFLSRVIYCEQSVYMGFTYVPRVIRKSIFNTVDLYREELNYFEDGDLLNRIKRAFSSNPNDCRIVNTGETGFYHVIDLRKRSSLRNTVKSAVSAGYYIIPFLRWNLRIAPKLTLPFLVKRIGFFSLLLLALFSLISPIGTTALILLLTLVLVYSVLATARAIKRTGMIFESFFLLPLRFVRGISEIAGVASYIKGALLGR